MGAFKAKKAPPPVPAPDEAQPEGEEPEPCAEGDCAVHPKDEDLDALEAALPK